MSGTARGTRVAAREIILFRHGPAERRAAGRADHARALTADGRRVTRAAARGLARLIAASPAILSSPARRARETAELLAAACAAEVEVDAALAPGATPATLAARVRATASPWVVVVGHEPDLSTWLAVEVGGADPSRLKIGKAAVAHLTLASGAAPLLRALLPRRVLIRLGA